MPVQPLMGKGGYGGYNLESPWRILEVVTGRVAKYRFRVVGPMGHTGAFPTLELAEDYGKYVSASRRGYYAVYMFEHGGEPELVAEFMSGVRVAEHNEHK